MWCVCIYTTIYTETLGRSDNVLRNSFIDFIQTYTETMEIISLSVDSDSIFLSVLTVTAFQVFGYPLAYVNHPKSSTGEGYHDWRGIYGGALEGEVWLL